MKRRGGDVYHFWRYARARLSDLRHRSKPFACWLADVIREKHNFPHFLIALLTLILAVFAGFAWSESKSGTAELKRQADSSQKQLQTLQDEQRPWLGMGFVGYPPDGPFQLGFINGGKSPALDVAVWARVVPGSFSEHPPLPSTRCTIDCKIDGVALLPSVPYQMVLLREQSGINPITSAPFFADKAAWIIGRADYRDASGGLHKTGICLFHRPEYHDLIACPMANSNYAD